MSDINTLTLAQATKLYNLIANLSEDHKVVKGFKDKPTALRRVAAALETDPYKWNLVDGEPELVHEHNPGPGDTEDQYADQPKRKGPAPEHADTDVINVNVNANPKRVGSMAHQRFALYTPGMTVAQFLAAGGTRADLHWDENRQYITVYTARQWANSEAGRDIEDDGDAA